MSLFELALMLGTPVYKLSSEMPYTEYVGWSLYLKKRPFGWREDYRASVVARTMSGSDTTKAFPALIQMADSESKRDSDAIVTKGSYLATLMLRASGDSPDFLKELM